MLNESKSAMNDSKSAANESQNDVKATGSQKVTPRLKVKIVRAMALRKVRSCKKCLNLFLPGTFIEESSALIIVSESVIKLNMMTTMIACKVNLMKYSSEYAI